MCGPELIGLGLYLIISIVFGTVLAVWFIVEAIYCTIKDTVLWIYQDFQYCFRAIRGERPDDQIDGASESNPLLTSNTPVTAAPDGVMACGAISENSADQISNPPPAYQVLSYPHTTDINNPTELAATAHQGSAQSDGTSGENNLSSVLEPPPPYQQ
ncbi:hypothetical protein NHQ30_010867 [Ciborinia camelliae]|nr:hypothetical protein NHQ30_010867 [Ciborinia camelliae]